MILPLELILWILMQKKIIYRATMPFIHITMAISGVILFAIGLICISISKEKTEDEMKKEFDWNRFR